MKLPELPTGYIWFDIGTEAPDIREKNKAISGMLFMYSVNRRLITGHTRGRKVLYENIPTFEEAAPLMAQLMWLGLS